MHLRGIVEASLAHSAKDYKETYKAILYRLATQWHDLLYPTPVGILPFHHRILAYNHTQVRYFFLVKFALHYIHFKSSSS